jgi:hypothetical protein
LVAHKSFQAKIVEEIMKGVEESSNVDNNEDARLSPP